MAPGLDEGAGHWLQWGSHLHWQLQFSDVLTRWRRFFHQMAAEQGQSGRAAVDTKLEMAVLQVSSPSPGTYSGLRWGLGDVWGCSRGRRGEKGGGTVLW